MARASSALTRRLTPSAFCPTQRQAKGRKIQAEAYDVYDLVEEDEI